MTFEQKDTILKRVGWGGLLTVVIVGFMHNLKMVSSNAYHFSSIIAVTITACAEYISYLLYYKEGKAFFDPIRIFALSVLVMIILNLAFGLGI